MEQLITSAYVIVPLWLMFAIRERYGFRWDMLGVVIHLTLVGARRGLVELGIRNPGLWTDIHGVTIILAMLGALIEVWRYRQMRKLLKKGAGR